MRQPEFHEEMGRAPTLAAGEYILWRGKPKKSAYIADKALTMLPIAVIWCVFDVQFLRAALDTGSASLLLFLLVHMFPVWLWIGNAVTAVLQWNNEDYFVTNKRIIIRKGILNVNRQSLFLRDVHSCDVHYGLLDHLFGSGDIYLNHTVHYSHRRNRRTTSGWYLLNLEDPESLRERIELLALEMEPGYQEEDHY